MSLIDLAQADSPRSSLIIFGVLLLPVVIAIWCVPSFMTMDGPAHLYNAEILSEFLKGKPPIRDLYVVHWTPLPNVAGHWLLAALLQVIPAWTAERLVMTLTSAGLSGTALWLRWRVAGRQGLALLSPLAVSLALNSIWLWGFYNFLLGACLFGITLGYWWAGRERAGMRWAVVLSGLLVLGYLCHLVSSVLTVCGLVILALTTPVPGWWARCRWTAVALIPIAPLAVIYHRLMRSAGGLHPVWRDLPSGHWSLRGWYNYLEASNPLNLLDSRALPFVDWTSGWFRMLHSSSWVAVALALLLIGPLFTRTRQHAPPARLYRGWLILTLLISLSYVVGPSDFGRTHGDYLRIRLFLLALMAIIPLVRADPKHLYGWIAAGALAVAVAIQSAVVWDCALISNRSVGLVMEAQPLVGSGKYIGTLRLAQPSRCIADVVSHADALLGIGTGNTVWNNYEAAAYYFPVKYRDERGPLLTEMFDASLDVNAPEAHKAIDRWARLFSEYHDAVDTFVVWGSHPGLDAMMLQWYGPEPVFHKENLRVFQRR
jgi:hypothetical protein